MAEIIVMPKMNLTMEEGFLAKWYKAAGDSVKIDEPICSIENAKETEDMLSPAAGILLRLIGEEGAEYRVAAPIAIIGKAGEDITSLQGKRAGKPDALHDDKKPDGPASSEVSGKAPDGDIPKTADKGTAISVKMMPKVRMLVNDLNIDIVALSAYCGGRKITEDEVLAFEKSRSGKIPSASGASVETSTGDRREKMSAMRKSIAKNMAQSCEKTARLTNFTEVDMTGLLGILKTMKDEGRKISVTAAIVRACALALRGHAIINTVLDDAADEIVFKGEVNISCAVDMPGGLAVPVIMNADVKGIEDISFEIAGFAERARTGRLTNQEMRNGTFTVSNVGMLDIDFFTPIINFPQAAILGIGAIRTLPRYMDDACEKLQPRRIMMIGLTYDHRVIDGAPASEFLKSVKALLQDCTGLF
jgi:pyruvate dehydrogenase E2 component (dihydrolipoamide acetyltransferase)